MPTINYWNNIANIIGTLITCFFIFGKSIKFKFSTNQKAISLLWCLVWAFLYASRPIWIMPFIGRIIFCANTILFIWLLAKIKLDVVISAYLISYGISYFFLCIATFIVSIIFAPFLNTGYVDNTFVDFNEPIYILFFTLIALLQFFLAYIIFQSRRLKNGFPFLFEKYMIVLALIVTGIVLTFVSLATAPRELGYYSNVLLIVVGVLVIGIGIIIWITRGIRMFYKKKMKERSIEILEQELAEKEHKLQCELEKNNKLRVESHKILNRFSSLERAVTIMLKDSHYAEFSEELSIMLEDIKRLSGDYHDGIAEIKGKKPLISTKIKMIDNLLMYFLGQCEISKIDFDIKVNGSIPYMIENIISQSKLETMIGDHLQDALIAVNASDNTYRCILAVLGIAGDCYEFTVFDSGIPFEVDTLIRLGTERVTTHADTGGSGIGFMTTFETMRECNASLIINEKRPSNVDYTKSVTIRFDGKNQYIIETYRSEHFPDDDRYKVIDTKKTN